jgi:hypothetical protein
MEEYLGYCRSFLGKFERPAMKGEILSLVLCVQRWVAEAGHNQAVLLHNPFTIVKAITLHFNSTVIKSRNIPRAVVGTETQPQ